MKYLFIVFLTVPGWVCADEVVHVVEHDLRLHEKPAALSVKLEASVRKPAGQTNPLSAWVETRVDGGLLNSDMDREQMVLKTPVPHLSFNPHSLVLVYQSSPKEKPVVCGVYSEGDWFKHAGVTPTGLCSFVTHVDQHRLTVDMDIRVSK